jgi:hypothetical protein
MSTKKPEKGHKAKLPGHDEDSREERSTKRHVYIEPGVKIDLVESLRKQQETAQNESTCHQQKQLFWTKVASALLFITAGLPAWQGYSTKLSADAARNIVERGNSRAIKFCTGKTLLITSPYPGSSGARDEPPSTLYLHSFSLRILPQATWPGFEMRMIANRYTRAE